MYPPPIDVRHLNQQPDHIYQIATPPPSLTELFYCHHNRTVTLNSSKLGNCVTIPAHAMFIRNLFTTEQISHSLSQWLPTWLIVTVVTPPALPCRPFPDPPLPQLPWQPFALLPLSAFPDWVFFRRCCCMSPLGFPFSESVFRGHGGRGRRAASCQPQGYGPRAGSMSRGASLLRTDIGSNRLSRQTESSTVNRLAGVTAPSSNFDSSFSYSSSTRNGGILIEQNDGGCPQNIQTKHQPGCASVMHKLRSSTLPFESHSGLLKSVIWYVVSHQEQHY